MSRFRFVALSITLAASLAFLHCGSDTFHTSPINDGSVADGATSDADVPNVDAGADACVLACPQVLASNVVLVSTIALDDTFVWYASREQTTAGGVWRVPKAGGATEQVVAAPSAYSVAVHRGVVFWTVAATVGGGGGIYQRFVDGGSPPVIARASPHAVDADDEGIYWAENDALLGGFLYPDAGADAASDGGALSSKLLGGQQVKRVVAQSDSVYFSSDSALAIYRVKKRGGPAQVPEGVLLGLGSVTTFAFGTSDEEVFWTINGDAQCAGGAVMHGTIQPDGRVTDGTPIAPDEPCASNVATDGAWVYWTTSPTLKTNNVRRVAKTGGAAQTLATAPSKPTSLAVDDTGIYWIGLDPQTSGQRSTISRIAPKPL